MAGVVAAVPPTQNEHGRIGRYTLPTVHPTVYPERTPGRTSLISLYRIIIASIAI